MSLEICRQNQQEVNPAVRSSARRGKNRRRRVGTRIIPESLFRFKWLAREHPTALTELLVHLRHWAEGAGIDFDAHAQVARLRFMAERGEKQLKRRLRRVTK